MNDTKTIVAELMILEEESESIAEEYRNIDDYADALNDLIDDIEEELDRFDNQLDIYLIPVGSLDKRPRTGTHRLYKVGVGYTVYESKEPIMEISKPVILSPSEIGDHTYEELYKFSDYFKVDENMENIMFTGFIVNKDDEVNVHFLRI